MSIDLNPSNYHENFETAAEALAYHLDEYADVADSRGDAERIVKAVVEAGWIRPAKLEEPYRDFPTGAQETRAMVGTYVEVTRTFRGRVVANYEGRLKLKQDRTGGSMDLRKDDQYRNIEDPLTIPVEPGLYMFSDDSIWRVDKDGDWTRVGNPYPGTITAVRKLIATLGTPKRLEVQN